MLWLAPPALAVPARAQSALDALRQRDQELEAVRTEQNKAAETEAKLKRRDRRARRGPPQAQPGADRYRRAACATLEDRIAETEARLKPLDDSERALRRSLDGRRAVIAEVLAALQRIGRRPPPALHGRPEDALQSVRTAIMLGAVLPEMRMQAEALAADLADLVRIRKEIADEKDRLAPRRRRARPRSASASRLLIDERQKKQAETEKALEAERQKAVALARQVDNLKDLIGKVEQGLDSAGTAARRPARDRASRSQGSDRTDLAALKDPGRLAPAVAFASARGRLPFPVNGVGFRNSALRTASAAPKKGYPSRPGPGAQVTAPCDGWVVYAGAVPQLRPTLDP